MTSIETKSVTKDIRQAIDKMRSLRDANAGVVDAVCCGRRAIPALRQLLFERDPSGLHQPRCCAVHALSMLGANDVLFEFLSAPPEARDPVERAGDDAVVSSAARCLSASRDERVLQLLLRLASGRRRPGVIGALASFRREEAIPYLVDALEEDDCRLLAEPAIIDFGQKAQPLLLSAATTPLPSAGSESETSIRKRRSALGLLMAMGIKREQWAALRHLISDLNPTIAVLACELCLRIAPESEWDGCVRRLVVLLEHADWRLENDVEECLVRFYPKAAGTISTMLRQGPDESAILRSREVLLRVKTRGALRELREQAHR
jgi:hypothetical protein